jgi:prolyl-tRNA editing enzyme YbaK/EbsC (Cys-tRNA(Pro) deacylase)
MDDTAREIPERVREVLDRHGLRALAFEPGSTPTSEKAAARIGAETGQIAKSILMCGKDGVYRLIVLRGDKRVHASKLKRATGCKHRMATPEETLQATGFAVGGVCPFALTGVEIYIDVGLGGYETIYPAAGTDASGVPLTLQRLAAITGGTVCDLARD